MQPADPPTSSTCFSPTTSSSTPLSRTVSLSSNTDITIEPSYPSDIQDPLATMRSTLENLEDIIRELETQTMNQGLAEGSLFAADIQKIRQDLDGIEKGHANGTQEIKLLMDDLVKKTSLAEIQKQVDEEIKQNMDSLIKEEVKTYLEQAIPSKIQQELQDRKKELDEVNRDLHNSESKRLNSLLRERNRHEPLRNIYRSNGEVSKHFPKTLDDLFNIDATTCKTLVQDYNLEVSASKDGNLNRFMVFCGVQYQMVRRGNDSKRVAFDIKGF
ncbi:hypothetical protein GYMLUDRAFT_43311 [Collybiopsis luxurians FD-317 M1]|uniref:Uncharacterized protein n=1 Tax=Collybiopsis luxurians FD-317 M1 TaxID=944289 RepID=A0A0D0CF93_9AGAR|nr:hypothetical protein GYMLUDRAFT_43311 [Collybiopsis luxurians FD-317 M1]